MHGWEGDSVSGLELQLTGEVQVCIEAEGSHFVDCAALVLRVASVGY